MNIPIKKPILVPSYLNYNEINMYKKLINKYLNLDTIENIIQYRNDKFKCTIIKEFLYNKEYKSESRNNIIYRCLFPSIQHTTYIYVSYRIIGDYLKSDIYSIQYVNSYGDCMNIICCLKKNIDIQYIEIIFNKNCINDIKYSIDMDIIRKISNKNEINKYILSDQDDVYSLYKLVILDISDHKKMLIYSLHDHISKLKENIIEKN